jgi:oxygen-independent coproporphyrinogen-3 oxidase
MARGNPASPNPFERNEYGSGNPDRDNFRALAGNSRRAKKSRFCDLMTMLIASPHSSLASASADRGPPLRAAATSDSALLRHARSPAPRYTSYPPANRFSEDLAALDLPRALADDNTASPGAAASPLSLYLHLPFCAQRCWYCGCHTVITRRTAVVTEYLDDLTRELTLLRRHLDPSRPVTQLHLGGGTPTFFPPEQLMRLTELLHRNLRFAPDAEISVEIDPRHLTTGHVDALSALGARRASLGIQDTDPEVQAAIHRIQPHSLNHDAVDALRAAGFYSINVDLIHGLPRQTPATFERTLDDVLTLRPDRFSVFAYAHVPWLKPAQRILETQHGLPSPDERLAMANLARERLTSAGLVDIGLDHFARPTDELARALADGTLHRNFQGYTTRGGASLYGLGISSISATSDAYYQNHKDLFSYRTALLEGRLPVERGHRLSAEDKRRRRLIMDIMCRRRLDFEKLDFALGLDVRATYAAEIASLADLAEEGFVELNDSSLRVTPAGLPLLRVIAARFDPALATSATRHSAAV